MVKIVAAWDQNMQPYYHFTSFDAFCEIYRTKKIRLSPCNVVKNAAVETMALYSELERIFTSDIRLQNSLLKLFNKESGYDLVNFLIEDRNKSYISCFSLFDENNEINSINDAKYMWKFYANDLNGVVIKFNFRCFPYTKHHTTGEQDVNGSFHRVTEIRMDKVIYDTDKLKKVLNQCANRETRMHTFATDVYKPKFCELEKEIRFLVYVADRAQLEGVSGISESGASSREMPEYLYYDFSAKETGETGPGIQKVFCKTERIHKALSEILDEGMIEYLHF